MSNEPTRILTADPPWKFDDKVQGGRGAEAHYACLEPHEIMRFPLPKIGGNAVLFLWMVESMPHEALDVVRAWGFKPKSSIVWVKTNKAIDLAGDPKAEDLQMGMGRIVRGAYERCIVATRGRGLEPVDKGVRNVFFAPRGEHSAKPKEFYELVRRLYPEDKFGRGVALFERTERPGFDCYGNELGRPHPGVVVGVDVAIGKDETVLVVSPGVDIPDDFFEAAGLVDEKTEEKQIDEKNVPAGDPRRMQPGVSYPNGAERGLLPSLMPDEEVNRLFALRDKLKSRGILVSVDEMKKWGPIQRDVAALYADNLGDLPEFLEKCAEREPHGALPREVVEDLAWNPSIVDDKTIDRYLAAAKDQRMLSGTMTRHEQWVRLQYVAPPGWFDAVDAEHNIETRLADKAAAAPERPIVKETVPGCAACDRGERFADETAYMHTGDGPHCGALKAAAAASTTPTEAPPAAKKRGRPKKDKTNGTNGTHAPSLPAGMVTDAKLDDDDNLLIHATVKVPKPAQVSVQHSHSNSAFGVRHSWKDARERALDADEEEHHDEAEA